MKGYINRFLEEKNYGFIVGDDNKSYFFHSSDLIDSSKKDKLIYGVVIDFSIKNTDKGARAVRINILNQSTKMQYELPDEVQHSKYTSIEDHDVLDVGSWFVTGSSRDSAEAAKLDALSKTLHLGGNALLQLQYFTTTGTEINNGFGVLNFTIHHCRGRVAIVGVKTTLNGVFKEDVSGIVNQKANTLKTQLMTKTKNKQLIAIPLIAGATLIGAIIGGLVLPLSQILLPIPEIVSAGLFGLLSRHLAGPLNYDSWLFLSHE